MSICGKMWWQATVIEKGGANCCSLCGSILVTNPNIGCHESILGSGAVTCLKGPRGRMVVTARDVNGNWNELTWVPKDKPAIVLMDNLESLCNEYDARYPMFGDQGRAVFDFVRRKVQV